MRNRGSFTIGTWCKGSLAAGMLILAAACSGDSPTESSNFNNPSPIAPGAPLFDVDEAGNGLGACMGDDTEAVNALYNPDLTAGGLPLNCTSNDIEIATATVTSYSFTGDPGSFVTLPEGESIQCNENETVFVETSAKLQNNAQSRYDVGVWIAEDGDNALTGSCFHFNLVLGDAGVSDLEGDDCGDMSQGTGLATVELDVLEVACIDNGSGVVEIDACIGWQNQVNENQGAPRICTDQFTPEQFRYATVPDNKAKCNCEPLVLPIIVNKSATIEVIKACPAGTTGSFDLEIDGAIEEENAACGGTTGAVTVSAGTNQDPGDDHNVSESGFTTANYNSSYSCTRNGGAAFTSGTGTSVADFEVLPEDVIVCTFTNEAIEVDVSKTAVESFTRTYTWNVDKSAGADTDIELAPGEIYEHPYSVTASVTGTSDTEHAVEGVITVTNPTSAAVTVNSVTDNIAGVGAATVTCEGITFPYELAAGEDFECTYESALPDGTTRVNTASVVLAGPADPFTGTASVDFTGVSPDLVDNCIVVKDEGDLGNTDPLGTVCVSGTPAPGGAFTAPKTFNYTRTVPTGAAQCGTFTYNNTATGTTNTTSTVITDAASIDVTIECPQGCTLTQGYWKTHNVSFSAARNGKGPAPDDNWQQLPDAELSGFFTTGGNTYPIAGPNAPSVTWFSVFMTAPKGNVYYVLAHQYMAAKLNVLNGVDASPAVDEAIADAEDLFDSYTPAYIGTLKGSNTLRQEFITLAGILGSFNEGSAGVDHCTEDANSLLQ